MLNIALIIVLKDREITRFTDLNFTDYILQCCLSHLTINQRWYLSDYTIVTETFLNFLQQSYAHRGLENDDEDEELYFEQVVSTVCGKVLRRKLCILTRDFSEGLPILILKRWPCWTAFLFDNNDGYQSKGGLSFCCLVNLSSVYSQYVCWMSLLFLMLIITWVSKRWPTRHLHVLLKRKLLFGWHISWLAVVVGTDLILVVTWSVTFA